MRKLWIMGLVGLISCESTGPDCGKGTSNQAGICVPDGVESDADADADADSDVSGTYEGTWEIDITTVLGSDNCSGDVTFSVDVGATEEIIGTGDCYFTDSGLASTLIGMGMIDALGPYGGDIEGDMTSDTTAEGVVPVDLLDSEPLEVSWTGTFGSGGIFTGDFEGSETLSVDIFGTGSLSDIAVTYDGIFETVLVD